MLNTHSLLTPQQRRQEIARLAGVAGFIPCRVYLPGDASGELFADVFAEQGKEHQSNSEGTVEDKGEQLATHQEFAEQLGCSDRLIGRHLGKLHKSIGHCEEFFNPEGRAKWAVFEILKTFNSKSASDRAAYLTELADLYPIAVEVEPDDMIDPPSPATPQPHTVDVVQGALATIYGEAAQSQAMMQMPQQRRAIAGFNRTCTTLNRALGQMLVKQSLEEISAVYQQGLAEGLPVVQAQSIAAFANGGE